MGVSVSSRSSLSTKTTGQSLWRVPLSARSEFHPHPLAEQAQACGRLTKAEGPEGWTAPIVTFGGYSWGKLHFSRVILAMPISVVQKKKRLHFSNCFRQPCAGTTLIFSVSLSRRET